MAKLVLAGIRPTEGYFKSEAVGDIKFLPKGNLHISKFTLEAPSLSFWMRKQQSLNEKVFKLVLTIAGKICYFFEASLLHPYMKQFFFLE